MIDGRKNSYKYGTAWFLAILITITTTGNYSTQNKFLIPLTASADTIPVVKNRSGKDTIPRVADTISLRRDSAREINRDSLVSLSDTIPLIDSTASITDTFDVQLSADSLDSPVSYSASDSMVLIIPEKKIILYSQGNIKKDDMDLSADSIAFDQSTNLIVATFRKDSLGNMIGRPKMIQGESTMESGFIQFNMKTQKGITRNTITQQGEMYVQGERIKKISPSEFFAYRGQFTTCNLDTPHFAFRTRKLKLVNQKVAVTGPIHPEFEGVPVPIYLPFGFFPISQGRHSGLLPPQFTASEQFGIGLQGLGYYKVLNDYFDVTLRGDIYSYGGWAMYFTPTYRKRYRYSGTMNFTMQQTRILNDFSINKEEEFETTKTFNIQWSHSMDSKARPGTSFSANVNAGSSKFNRFVINNATRNYQNNLSSSITYSKTWGGQYNLTVSANHSQNNNNGVFNINLPNIAFTANTMYPLQPKNFAGTPKWYQKLGIGLNTNIANQISFYDSLFSFTKILDTMQWGAQHNIPIQLSLPQLGPVQISPGISYQQRWYSKKFIRTFNDSARTIDIKRQNGFFVGHDISFSIGASTALFGTFDKFKKSSRIKGIRHVIRPNISMNYKPDLSSEDFYTVRVRRPDSTLVDQRFNYFSGNVYGPFGEGRFGGIGFGIDNNLEMKVRSKTDTSEGGLKKVRLIDGFGFNGSYNMLADSFNLGPISLYLRSTLFEDINITASATLDPYQFDKFGDRMNRYAWQGDKFSLGRITNGSIAISTSFRSKQAKEQEKQEQEELANTDLPPMTMEEQMAQLEYVRQNPAEFADFNIPWSLNISYALSFSRTPKPDFSGMETQVYSNFNWNGDFNLTPRWKMGVSGYYDLSTTTLQSLTMFISREMHCWQLSINVTPVGLFRSFNITINPKSGLLRDLKVNRTRFFYGS